MIVIHIGLPKSGSSTLQNFLSTNREFLQSQSISNPHIGREHNNHHNIAHELLDSNRFDPELGGLNALAKFWKRKESMETMVLTSEVFERLSPQAISHMHDRLAAAREGETFKIYMVVRDLVDLMPSSYGQKIRYGHNRYEFDEFFAERMAEERTDCFDTAARWAAVFGWKNLCVRALDRRGLVNGDLLDDFLTVLGVDPKGQFTTPLNRTGVRNISSGWRVQEAVRALYGRNHGLPKGHQAWMALRKGGKNKDLGHLARELGEELGWNDDKGRYLTREQAQQCLDIHRATIEALNKHLPQKLPLPLDLDARNFVARGELPSAALIPPEELRSFYDQLGERWAEKAKEGKKSDRLASKKARQEKRAAKKEARQRGFVPVPSPRHAEQPRTLM